MIVAKLQARMIDKMKERREELECADSITSKLDFVGDAAAQYLVECSATTGVSNSGYKKVEKAMYGARFRLQFTLEDAIGSHACSLEASIRVTNGITLGCSYRLLVHTVNSVQT
jgi:hypothetical protein